MEAEAEAEKKREVGANGEKVKQREDKHDKAELATILFAHA